MPDDPARPRSAHGSAARASGRKASRPAAPAATRRDAEHRDAEHRDADHRDRAPRTGRVIGQTRGYTVLISVLLALLGFGIAVQIRSVSASDQFAGARPDDLARILTDLSNRQVRLQAQIQQLQETLRQLNAAGEQDRAAEEAARRKADALAVLTGTVPVSGPGVVLTVTDPDGRLAAEDLLDIVQELRGAGAEAIQFGPVRVIVSSYFVDTDAGIQLDGVTIKAPYRILAIGPAATMASALRIPNGVVSTVDAAGGRAGIEESPELHIAVVRTLPKTKYSTPQR